MMRLNQKCSLCLVALLAIWGGCLFLWGGSALAQSTTLAVEPATGCPGDSVSAVFSSNPGGENVVGFVAGSYPGAGDGGSGSFPGGSFPSLGDATELSRGVGDAKGSNRIGFVVPDLPAGAYTIVAGPADGAALGYAGFAVPASCFSVGADGSTLPATGISTDVMRLLGAALLVYVGIAGIRKMHKEP